MNKYKFFLFLLIALFCCYSGNSQIDYEGIEVVVDECDECLDIEDYNYTGEYTFTTEDVVSDFGPRMICDHDFHGGIDYTSQTEDVRVLYI